jgi:predicted dehydrogenase
VNDPEVVVIHRTIGGALVSETLRLENFPGGSSYWRQLDNFVTSIANRGKPDVDGWQAVRVLELIESCYAHKRRIAEPWAESGTESEAESGTKSGTTTGTATVTANSETRR